MHLSIRRSTSLLFTTSQMFTALVPRVLAVLAPRMLAPRVLASTTCLYTMADDGNFVIAPHPDTERITLVSACSGHGFKHSAALGESLAQHITGQPTRCDLGSFIAPR